MPPSSQTGAWEYALPKGRPLDPGELWVARDVQGRDRPTKRFRCFGESWVDYEMALFGGGEGAQRHMYELIPDGELTPVWFFADHDCKTSDARGMAVEEFLAEVRRVHLSHFGLGEEDVGSLVFVSSTCRPGKLSAHVKVNLETTLSGARAHAEAICDECGPDDRIKPDLSVYSGRAQQIRALGSSKLGSGVAKAPAQGCAGGSKTDHMVRVNPGHGMRVISRPCPERPPRAKAARRSPLDGGEAVVRAALTKSLLCEGRMLGGTFDPGACRIEDVRTGEDGETVFCYVDGSMRHGGGLRCPFAGRAHKTNRALVVVAPNGGDRRRGDPGTGEVVYKCMDEACRENGKRLAAPYDIRGIGGGGPRGTP